MNKLLLLSLLFLLIAVLTGIILSIQSYRKRIKYSQGAPEKAIGSSGSGNGILLLVFGVIFPVCAIASTIYYSGMFSEVPKAEPSAHAMPLLVVTTALTGIAFLATQVLLFLFLFRYQSSKSENASYIKGELKLEFTWTIIPAITFLFLFFWGQRLWHEIINTPADAIEIEVVAQQFVWKARYPGQDRKFGRSGFQFTTKLNDIGLDRSDPMSQDDFVPIQMHVPKNRPVKIHLRSNDVIHSFYVPAFKIKMDAVPGMTTTTYFTANHTTNEMRERLKNSNFDYEVGCAELCGRMHFAMKMILVVDEPEEFEKWYRTQKSLVLSEKM